MSVSNDQFIHLPKVSWGASPPFVSPASPDDSSTACKRIICLESVAIAGKAGGFEGSPVPDVHGPDPPGPRADKLLSQNLGSAPERVADWDRP